jgi:hypothetical protein
MKVDQAIKDIRFSREDYDFNYVFTYHEGCDRMTFNKKDGTEEYIFDIFNFRQVPEEIYLEWALPRLIRKDGKTEVSPLDPEVWEFIEGCKVEGLMFANNITGAWAAIDKESGRVKLLSKGHSSVFDPIEMTRNFSKLNLNLSLQERNKKNKSKNKSKVNEAEIKARNTLRDLVSEKEWKRYVTNGYILIKGSSEKIYQIFSNHSQKRIRVFEKGNNIHDLCVHSDGGVPDTDHVLNCMLLIKNDEKDFYSMCNKHAACVDNIPDYEVEPRFKNKSLKEVLEINKRIYSKLKISDDWIDATEEKSLELKQMEIDIAEKLSIQKGLRDVAAGRVIQYQGDILVDEMLGPDFFDEPIVALAQ